MEITILDGGMGQELLSRNSSRPTGLWSARFLAVAELSGCGLLVGAYANGFTRITDAFLDPGATVDTLQKRQDMDPETYAGFAADWISRGVGIVGGCCEVGPAHIAFLRLFNTAKTAARRRFKSRNFTFQPRLCPQFAIAPC